MQDSDPQLRSKATTRASIRGAAAVYIAYLGWTILRAAWNGESTLSPWLSWLAGLGFIAAALAFGFYAFRRYQSDLAAAVIKPESESESEP